MGKTIRGAGKLTLSALILLLLWLASPHRALADGGAPQLAYVSGTARGISVIDIAQQKVADSLALPGNPALLQLSNDGAILYVTQPDLNRVTFVAMKTKQTICSASVSGHPSLLALDPGAGTVYVAGSQSGQVTALNAQTCATHYTVQVPSTVEGLALALNTQQASQNQLWIASAQELSIFRANGEPLAHIKLSFHPRFLCIPAGPTVYVTTQEGTLLPVDIATRRVLAPLLSGGDFGPMDYDATTGEIYVPDRQHQRVDIVAPVSADTHLSASLLRRVISLPAQPQSIAITSDGQLGFIALSNGTVVELDIPGHTIIRTLRVGGSPRFIITGLYPSLFNFTNQQSAIVSWLADALHYVAALIIALTALIAILVQRRKARRNLASRPNKSPMKHP